MKKFIVALCTFLFLSSAIAEDKKYVDDCQHWIEISLGAIIIQHDGEYNLAETIEIIHQYLDNSGISLERQSDILLHITDIWMDHYEISQDLPEKLYLECDVR
jgi:hypothetical protein